MSKILGNVSYKFFGREEGFSSGVYSSLNCSKFVEDDSANVERNLAKAQKIVGAKSLITLKQVHGIDCLTVDENTKSDLEFDAMVTNIPGIAIGILTADCAPILFYDDEKQVIGAAHAGWKGAVAGVIESTIQAMRNFGCAPANIKVAIGPCIHQQSFEVQDDFVQQFPQDCDCFICRNDSIYFDLPKFCSKKLQKQGIHLDNIDISEIDTYLQNEKYFSFRYARAHSNGFCGRNLSVICLK